MIQYTPEEIRAAVIKAFSGAEGQIALAAIAEFARAHDEEFIADARLSDFYAGRRSVLAYIHNILTGDKKHD
jgi:hypothetical protein